MSKHVTKIAAALVAYGTTRVQVTEMRRALEVDCATMSDSDKVRLDRTVVESLASFYQVEYKPVEKGGKLSRLTLPQGAPSVALSKARAIILGKTKRAKDERTPAERHAAVMLQMLQSDDKGKQADAKKWIKRLAAHLSA
jgi:hypothetical protein